MIKVYRKTGTIKAEQYDGSNEMIDKYHLRCDIGFLFFGNPLKYKTVPYQLETQYGWGNISVGDWIATNDDGKYILITDDFKKTYAELPAIPNYVAEYINIEKNNTDVIQAGIDAIEYSKGNIELTTWIEENGDMFARAWLNGFQTEEDE